MAKQMAYTHPNGTEYPQSYWRIVELHVNVPDRHAEFKFYGYKDQAAREQAREPIGEKSIHIVGDDFDTNYTEVTLKAKNPQEVGYDYATQFKDIHEDVLVNQGTPDEMIVKQPRSFFRDSIDC
jgi:hypothetical protein